MILDNNIALLAGSNNTTTGIDTHTKKNSLKYISNIDIWCFLTSPSLKHFPFDEKYEQKRKSDKKAMNKFQKNFIFILNLLMCRHHIKIK